MRTEERNLLRQQIAIRRGNEATMDEIRIGLGDPAQVESRGVIVHHIRRIHHFHDVVHKCPLHKNHGTTLYDSEEAATCSQINDKARMMKIQNMLKRGG